jgi:uncharacterized membrane protein
MSQEPKTPSLSSLPAATRRIMQDARFTRVIGGIMALVGVKLPLPLRLVAFGLGGYLAVTGQPRIQQAQQKVLNILSHRNTIVIERAVTIHRSLGAVFTFWRDFTNYPLYLTHVRAVEALDDTGEEWHFRMEAPASIGSHWYVRLSDVQDQRLIAWENAPRSEMKMRGSIRFREVPQRHNLVEVKFTFAYQPLGGSLAYGIAKFQEEALGQVVKAEMMRLKQVLETGEYSRTTGQPHGEQNKGSGTDC